jgi:hypothetical protein
MGKMSVSITLDFNVNKYPLLDRFTSLPDKYFYQFVNVTEFVGILLGRE